MRLRGTLALLLVSVVSVPRSALSQAIAGTVDDAIGAALPGVQIQLESPALIERNRTVVTDQSGQYLVDGLPPGLYTLTFTREGFRRQVRADVKVTSAFTTSIN